MDGSRTPYDTPEESVVVRKEFETLLNHIAGNAVAFAATIVVNALSTFGVLGRTTGEISDSYPNSFVPAGWAFSIWAVIYVFQLAFCIYTGMMPKGTDASHLVLCIGPFFIVSCLLNIAWVVTFAFGTHLALFLSTLWLIALLVILLVITFKINSWREHRSSLWDFWIIDVGFSIYTGWITVATIAGLVLSLKYFIGWDGSPWTESGWSALVIAIAAAVSVAVMATRRDAAFAFVFSWAAFAIADGHSTERPVMISALVCASVVAAGAGGVSIYHIIRWTMHRNVIGDHESKRLVNAFTYEM